MTTRHLASTLRLAVIAALLACSCATPPHTSTSTRRPARVAADDDEHQPGPVVELDPATGRERRWTSSDGLAEASAPSGHTAAPGALSWAALAPRLGAQALAVPGSLRVQRIPFAPDDEALLVQGLSREPGGYYLAALLPTSDAAPASLIELGAADSESLEGDFALTALATTDLDGDGQRELIARYEERLPGVGLVEHSLIIATRRDDGTLTLVATPELALGEPDAASGDETIDTILVAPPAIVRVSHQRAHGERLTSTAHVLELAEGTLREAAAAQFLFVDRHTTLADARAHAAELAASLDLSAIAVPDPDERHHLVLLGPVADAARLARRLSSAVPDAVVIADGRLTPFFGAVWIEPRADDARRGEYLGTSVLTREPMLPAEAADDDAEGDDAERTLRRRRSPGRGQ